MGKVEFKAAVSDDFRGVITLEIQNRRTGKSGRIQIGRKDFYIRRLTMKPGEYTLSVRAVYGGREFQADAEPDTLCVGKKVMSLVQIRVMEEKKAAGPERGYSAETGGGGIYSAGTEADGVRPAEVGTGEINSAGIGADKGGHSERITSGAGTVDAGAAGLNSAGGHLNFGLCLVFLLVTLALTVGILAFLMSQRAEKLWEYVTRKREGV